MTGLELNNREKYVNHDDKAEIFFTGELKAYKTAYTDPLILNFKLMIDFDKKSGLFASKENINSALAYLLRIGETARYHMLTRWIEVFQDFVRNHDFLILDVIGLDTIVNAPPYHAFTLEDKLTLTIRETNDMFFQSLLTTYRHIWFDDNRCVEVLPANLRRFDAHILLFNSGYYNMDIYDVNGIDSVETETKIFPTLRKLSDKYFYDNADKYEFNHHLISFVEASINNEESGKSFFENVTNEMTDEFVKNQIVLNYRFGNYRGVFNNIFGEIDFVKELAVIASYDKTLNQNTTEKSKLNEYFSSTGESLKSLSKEQWNKIKNSPQRIKKYVGQNTAIGQAFRTLSDPSLIPNMISNTIDRGMNYLEDQTIGAVFTGINNLILQNFSNNLVDIYKSYNEQNTVNNLKTYSDEELLLMTKDEETNPNGAKFQEKIEPYMDNSENKKNIKLEASNIYNRGGF